MKIIYERLIVNDTKTDEMAWSRVREFGIKYESSQDQVKASEASELRLL